MHSYIVVLCSIPRPCLCDSLAQSGTRAFYFHVYCTCIVSARDTQTETRSSDL